MLKEMLLPEAMKQFSIRNVGPLLILASNFCYFVVLIENFDLK